LSNEKHTDARGDRLTRVFDPAHTYIGFSVRHMVVTNVQGRLKEFSGTIVL